MHKREEAEEDRPFSSFLDLCLTTPVFPMVQQSTPPTITPLDEPLSLVTDSTPCPLEDCPNPEKQPSLAPQANEEAPPDSPGMNTIIITAETHYCLYILTPREINDNTKKRLDLRFTKFVRRLLRGPDPTLPEAWRTLQFELELIEEWVGFFHSEYIFHNAYLRILVSYI